MKALSKAKRAPRRSLFAELSEGMAALAQTRGGKRTLRIRPFKGSRFAYPAA
jgi:hypothetical protein